MRFAAALATTLAIGCTAVPTVSKRTGITDVDVLEFALFLENLEAAFYREALNTFTEEDFTSAGFSEDFYLQLKYIALDEQKHVVFLKDGLTAAGGAPVEACSYNFGLTTPQAFVATAAVVEGLGVCAYTGAAQFIGNKSYLTAAAAILATEALHQSAARNAVGEIPMANAFATPLSPNAVYSIASGFVLACPSTNYAIPVKAYPSLTVLVAATAAGETIVLSADPTTKGISFATFVSGLSIISVPATLSVLGTVTVEVPEGVEGQSYVFLTTDDSGVVTDENVLAGPAIIEAAPGCPELDPSIRN